MPVVINEFEVITEPPPPVPAESADAAPSEQPSVTPHAIERVIEQQAERAMRTWAH